MTKLLVVESPTKAREIRHFLESGWEILPTMGHLRRIPPRGLNIDIAHGFTPTFEVSPDRMEAVQDIQEAAAQADEIYLATDPDREGESIAAHVVQVLQPECRSKCRRVVYNAVTKKAGLAAIAKPREIDQHLVDAQQARQVLDRLVGYKVSPQLWSHVAPKTSAGRVQSVALRVICDRQTEIDAFKSEDFWHVDVLLGCAKGEFWARTVTGDQNEPSEDDANKDDSKNRFRDEHLATTAYEMLQKSQFKMHKIERKSKKQKPHPPFDTSSMQSTCNALLGWNATHTMEIAQSLFECGRITYHRTDSFNIDEEALAAVRSHIQTAYPLEYLPAAINVFKQKSTAAAQEAHEAIRPTEIANAGEDLSGEEAKLYKLVRDRFVACQMADMVLDTVAYQVKASSGHNLIARGQTVRFDGWRRVWSHVKTDEVILPDADEGQTLDYKDSRCTKHSTKPPPRFTEGSLLKRLKEHGVGRPATQASVLQALRDREYVVEDGKAMVPTELGRKICTFLVAQYDDFFMDIRFTARLEDDLLEIANGTKKFLLVVQSFYDVLAGKMGEAIHDQETTGQKCPECGVGEIIQRHGKFGLYFVCSNYPDCKTTLSEHDGKFVKKIGPRLTGHNCQACKEGAITERQGAYGVFYGCNRYPECKARYTRLGNDYLLRS